MTTRHYREARATLLCDFGVRAPAVEAAPRAAALPEPRCAHTKLVCPPVPRHSVRPTVEPTLERSAIALQRGVLADGAHVNRAHRLKSGERPLVVSRVLPSVQQHCVEFIMRGSESNCEQDSRMECNGKQH